ncbi:OB-fold domain-containing protein [Jatrophihabitans sp.]|uniref:Zn-ribbon domain-containing OB-fold protein n=1 Tax=Jatrophihabitans sp. TaxID=1932789 RepID=UPI0030C74E3C|nr:hypothetical protein [Jatrophihabitans sp.]
MTESLALDAPFWEGARTGELRFQRCTDCGFLRWPAAGVCPECLSRSAVWEAVEPVGTVWSFVIYHRSYSRSAPPPPYLVALVELDCGVRLITTLAGSSADHTVGMRVRARFEEFLDRGVVPVFAAVE